MVHGISLLNLPSLRTFKKSPWVKKPSRGLKTPVAIFSASVLMSGDTSNVFKSSRFPFVRLLINLPPCGKIRLEDKNNYLPSFQCNPHSLWTSFSHHHRPALGSSPFLMALVHGSQPILGYPLSCSSLYGISFS